MRGIYIARAKKEIRTAVEVAFRREPGMPGPSSERIWKFATHLISTLKPNVVDMVDANDLDAVFDTIRKSGAATKRAAADSLHNWGADGHITKAASDFEIIYVDAQPESYDISVEKLVEVLRDLGKDAPTVADVLSRLYPPPVEPARTPDWLAAGRKIAKQLQGEARMLKAFDPGQEAR